MQLIYLRVRVSLPSNIPSWAAPSKIIYQHSKTLQIPKTIKFRYFKVHKWPIHLYVEIVQFFNNLHEGQRIEQFETLSISDSSHVFYVTPIDVEQIHLIYLLTRLDEGKRNPNKLKQAF